MKWACKHDVKHSFQLPDLGDPLVIANNHDLDPEEIAERLKQQQHESEKDAQWLMAEERMLVSIVISNM